MSKRAREIILGQLTNPYRAPRALLHTAAQIFADNILEALTAAGLRVVPVEPSAETLWRVAGAIRDSIVRDKLGDKGVSLEAARAAYAAMVAGDGND